MNRDQIDEGQIAEAILASGSEIARALNNVAVAIANLATVQQFNYRFDRDNQVHSELETEIGKNVRNAQDGG